MYHQQHRRIGQLRLVQASQSPELSYPELPYAWRNEVGTGALARCAIAKPCNVQGLVRSAPCVREIVAKLGVRTNVEADADLSLTRVLPDCSRQRVFLHGMHLRATCTTLSLGAGDQVRSPLAEHVTIPRSPIAPAETSGRKKLCRQKTARRGSRRQGHLHSVAATFGVLLPNPVRQRRLFRPQRIMGHVRNDLF
jgi:hypothetical protein